MYAPYNSIEIHITECDNAKLAQNNKLVAMIIMAIILFIKYLFYFNFYFSSI